MGDISLDLDARYIDWNIVYKKAKTFYDNFDIGQEGFIIITIGKGVYAKNHSFKIIKTSDFSQTFLTVSHNIKVFIDYIHTEGGISFLSNTNRAKISQIHGDFWNDQSKSLNLIHNAEAPNNL